MYFKKIVAVLLLLAASQSKADNGSVTFVGEEFARCLHEWSEIAKDSPADAGRFLIQSGAISAIVAGAAAGYVSYKSYLLIKYLVKKAQEKITNTKAADQADQGAAWPMICGGSVAGLSYAAFVLAHLE